MALTARDIMTPTIVSLERGHTVIEAAEMMEQHSVSCLLVTVGGYPVGIVTETDIVRLLSKRQDPSVVTVEHIMSSPLFSTAPDADILAVANTMTANHIKKMPVLERQHVVGIITQTDIVHYALRACSLLQSEYAQGKIGAHEFAARSQELFVSVPNIPDDVKSWHMVCQVCKYQFLADEKHGKLTPGDCPSCRGPIRYDPSPPI